MPRNKTILCSALLVLLSLAGCVFYTGGSAVRSGDGPFLIVIPGTYVYYYDAPDTDIYFYSGRWWRFHQKAWYRGDYYSGPWVVIEVTWVPRPVSELPYRQKNWRNRDRLRWNDVRDNWREWERDRYWEKRGWRRDDDRRDNGYRDKNGRHDRDDRERSERDNKDKKPKEPRKLKADAELE